jgi:hypothetical protein
MITHNKESRRLFFAKALQEFVPLKFPNNKVVKNDVTYNIMQVVDADKIINEYYWDIVENNLKPLLEIIIGESTEQSEKRSDFYKILSATEFAIMSCKPFFLTNEDGTELNYNGEQTYINEEVKLNSNFAVHCALNLLLNWHGYKPYVSKDIIQNIFVYKEKIPERADSMTIIDEHKTILEYANLTIGMTILTNATWWRMFCFAAFLCSDNTIDLTKYSQQR